MKRDCEVKDGSARTIQEKLRTPTGREVEQEQEARNVTTLWKISVRTKPKMR